MKLVHLSKPSVQKSCTIPAQLVMTNSACTAVSNCLLLQHGDSEVRTHHLEYNDGGILDMDDPLADLVEDRERVRVFIKVSLCCCCSVLHVSTG